jgi:hypothetical protein
MYRYIHSSAHHYENTRDGLETTEVLAITILQDMDPEMFGAES